MTLRRALCEACGQRVGVGGPDSPDGRRRLVLHKVTTRRGHQAFIDWCEGRFERQEVQR